MFPSGEARINNHSKTQLPYTAPARKNKRPRDPAADRHFFRGTFLDFVADSVRGFDDFDGFDTAAFDGFDGFAAAAFDDFDGFAAAAFDGFDGFDAAAFDAFDAFDGCIGGLPASSSCKYRCPSSVQ